MKIALVHDYIKEYGGAERVLEALHELYPDAPVFTSVYLPGYLGPHKERFASWDIRTSWLQRIPFKAKLISPFRLLAPFVFKQFDFSGFDVILTSATGAYFPNAIHKKQAKLICYCHTPPRYLYGYATAREWKKNIIFRILGEVANHFLRMVDYNAAQNVDQFIANSEEVKSRIQKFYRKDAVVVYPPVKVVSPPAGEAGRESSVVRQKTDYYLAGGRLARAKHIDLIIRTWKDQTVPLKIFGKGFAGYEEELRKLVVRGNEGKIEFVGEVSDEEKFELMKEAKAYIMASEDEDFGILPVEAMAAGTPVIAYRSGGVKETVLQSRTGIFFDDPTTESLIEAIKKFEKMQFDPAICRKQGEKFSKARFIRNINEYVEKLANTEVTELAH